MLTEEAVRRLMHERQMMWANGRNFISEWQDGYLKALHRVLEERYV